SITNTFEDAAGKTNYVGGLRFIGAGPGTRSPIPLPPLATFIFNENKWGQPAFTCTAENNFEISHLRIVGNPNSGPGIRLQSVGSTLIDDLIIDSSSVDDGIHADGVQLTEFRRLLVGGGNDKHSFHFSGGAIGVSLVDCYTSNGGQNTDGVFFEPGRAG